MLGTGEKVINLEEFRANGYCRIPSFFKSKARSLLFSAGQVFKNAIDARGGCGVSQRDVELGMRQLFKNDFQTFVNCGKTCQNLLEMYQLAVDSQTIRLLSKLRIQDPAISTRPVMFFNHPDIAKREVYYKTPPHQDWRSIQGSLNSVVIWVPLVDVPAEMGPLEIIPGSHLRGLCTDRIEDNFGVCSVDESEFVPVEVAAGDALIISTFLIHRSGNNVSDRIRWSCHFRYNDLEEKSFMERGYPSPYVYYPDSKLITPDFPLPEDVKKAYNNS